MRRLIRCDGVPEPLAPAWARLGVALRLLLLFRWLGLAMAVPQLPPDRLDGPSLATMAVLTLETAFVLFAWRTVLPCLTKWPALWWLDALLVVAVLAQTGVSGPCFAFTVLTSAIAGVMYPWRWMLAICVAQILLYYAAVGLGETAADGVATAGTLVALPGFYPLAACAGVALRRLFDQYAEAEAARRRAEAESAAAEERARLAREMHDSLAKTLQGIALSATALPTWIRRSPDRAEHAARDIVDALQIASREARGLIADLREEIGPLVEAVGQTAAEWSRAYGVPLETEVEDEPGLRDVPLLIRHEVVAVLKEALSNVARHAGARSVEVRLRLDTAHRIELTVRDDGGGFEPPADDELSMFTRDGHYGLVGMRERVRRVGGDLEVGSAPGAGTTVKAIVPGPPAFVPRTGSPERQAS
ncbi:hypothetical protein J4573_15135 [Actinomadura barringtoniae]|uniref:histidine kinase n=1 Tax=Actinomadura barringtoniae TaxID=1427535 RepID=A0A939T4M5_9ACTN|nr:ATP-binding protein [Actinomadura barringtoniae]MBO2448434.1 hypothetical protein [Actinomadura barringtoniae]